MSTFFTKEMLFQKAMFTAGEKIAIGSLKEALFGFAVFHNSPDVYFIETFTDGKQTIVLRPKNQTWMNFAKEHENDPECKIKLYTFSGCSFVDAKKRFRNIPILAAKNKRLAEQHKYVDQLAQHATERASQKRAEAERMDAIAIANSALKGNRL